MSKPLPDIRTVEDIERFVTSFYDALLQDSQLAPIFLDVAVIDLNVHKPLIISYWEKLLLGGRDYQRHTMNIHRAVHLKEALPAADFEQWLRHFEQSMDTLFCGQTASKAKQVAARIAANMQHSL